MSRLDFVCEFICSGHGLWDIFLVSVVGQEERSDPAFNAHHPKRKTAGLPQTFHQTEVRWALQLGTYLRR